MYRLSDTVIRAIRRRRLPRETSPDPLELARRRFLHGRIVIETRVAAERHRLLRGAYLLDRGAHAFDGHGLIRLPGDYQQGSADGCAAHRVALEEAVNPHDFLPSCAQQR